MNSIVSTIAMCLLFAGAGVGSGIGAYALYDSFFSFSAVNYDEFSIEDYEDDQNDLMMRYAKSSNGDYSKIFKSYELVNIAMNKCASENNCYVVGKGLVTATMNVKQTIRSTYIKNGDSYFFENISASSFVKVDKRFYQWKDSVDIYVGDHIDENSANWPENPTKTSTLEEFENDYGRNLTRGSIFIISSKTVIEEGCSVNKVGDEYHVSLSLDPITSVLRYVKQMKSTSDLADYPAFHSVRIDYVLDKDLRLISDKTDELYDVKSFGVTSKNTKGALEQKYYYDYKEIPSLETNCNYSEEEVINENEIK